MVNGLDSMSDTRTDTITERPTEVVEEGDHEKCAHIVVPKSAVTEAYITGASVTAICGKRWKPYRDPDSFPVCQGCIEVYEAVTGKTWAGRR